MDAFDPPPGTYPFDPPVEYGTLWASVEDCSGLRGDMSRIEWFAIPGSRFSCRGGDACTGLWRSPHTIFLSEAAKDGQTGPNYLAVRHEMLHDLLGGGEDHPPIFFQCGLMGSAGQ